MYRADCIVLLHLIKLYHVLPPKVKCFFPLCGCNAYQIEKRLQSVFFPHVSLYFLENFYMVCLALSVRITFETYLLFSIFLNLAARFLYVPSAKLGETRCLWQYSLSACGVLFIAALNRKTFFLCCPIQTLLQKTTQFNTWVALYSCWWCCTDMHWYITQYRNIESVWNTYRTK